MSDGPVSADYAKLDDSTLIATRCRVRDELEREPPNMAELIRAHHLLSTEVVRRVIALRKQAREEGTGNG